jgi:hypothetical protein
MYERLYCIGADNGKNLYMPIFIFIIYFIDRAIIIYSYSNVIIHNCENMHFVLTFQHVPTGPHQRGEKG